MATFTLNHYTIHENGNPVLVLSPSFAGCTLRPAHMKDYCERIVSLLNEAADTPRFDAFSQTEREVIWSGLELLTQIEDEESDRARDVLMSELDVSLHPAPDHAPPAPRYVVDGTMHTGERVTGYHQGPFLVFDVQSQGWCSPGYAAQEDAQRIADALNAHEARSRPVAKPPATDMVAWIDHDGACVCGVGESVTPAWADVLARGYDVGDFEDWERARDEGNVTWHEASAALAASFQRTNGADARYNTPWAYVDEDAPGGAICTPDEALACAKARGVDPDKVRIYGTPF